MRQKLFSFRVTFIVDKKQVPPDIIQRCSNNIPRSTKKCDFKFIPRLNSDWDDTY